MFLALSHVYYDFVAETRRRRRARRGRPAQNLGRGRGGMSDQTPEFENAANG